MGYLGDVHIGRNQLRRVEVVAVEDTGKQQLVTVKGLEGEVMKLAYRGQYFGASGVPPVGSDGFALLVGGRPDQAILMGLEHPDHRPTGLGEGERVLYNAHGDKIFQYKERIKTVTKTWELEADTIKLTGAIQITGDITQAGQLTSTGPHVASAHI